MADQQTDETKPSQLGSLNKENQESDTEDTEGVQDTEASSQQVALRGVSVEDAIRHAGGMGRFQWLLTLMYQLIFSCGSFSLYPMMYYELQPIYRCRENESQDFKSIKQRQVSKMPGKFD